MGSTVSMVQARESPDSIRTGDIFVQKEEGGLLYRFEGSDEEYVEMFAEERAARSPNDTTLLRPLMTNFFHDIYKRKPSLAILHMYNADNKLQQLNIDVNKSAKKADLSDVSKAPQAENYNNEKGENCAKPLLELYLNPDKRQIRELERCIGNTYCSTEYSKLMKVANESGITSVEYRTQLDKYSDCAMKRPEFVHVQRAVDKQYADDTTFAESFE